ncbi:MAG: MFS transporter [Bacillota bacterium]
MSALAKRLLALLLLVLLGQALSALFVQAYVWERGGDLVALSRFNLAAAIAMAAAFVVLGPMVKRGRSVVAVRIGLLVQVAFFLAILALGAEAGRYLEALGTMNGLGMGAFWVGQNILIQEATGPEGRARFWGYVGACWSATALVGPLTGSRVVAGLGPELGYQVLFGLAAASYALAGLVSVGVSSRGSAQPYHLVAGLLDDGLHRPWWRLLAAHVVAGFRDSVLSFLPLILVYGVTGDAKIMGNFAFITSAVGLASNWATGRMLPRHRWWVAMLVSGLCQAGAALLMLASLSVTTLLLYTLIAALVGPLLGVPFLSHTFDTIGSGHGDSQMERIVVREVFLVAGRSGGMLLLLLLSSLLTQEQTAAAMLAIVAVAAVLPALIVRQSLSAHEERTA